MTTFNGIHPFPAPPYLYHGGSHSPAMDSTVHSLIYKIHETEKSESETPCSQNTFTHTQMQITNLKTKHKQQREEAKIEIKHVVVELAVHYCLSCKTIINHLLCKY